MADRQPCAVSGAATENEPDGGQRHPLCVAAVFGDDVCASM